MAGNNNSGRKALPATVHLLHGNPSKKSAAELKAAQQAKPDSELPVKIPPCPAFLTPDAKTEWKRIAKDLTVLGMVNELDRGELAVYCQAWADWKKAREMIAGLGEVGMIDETPNGFKQISVWMQIANRAEERMNKAGSNFGFNPAARSKLGPTQQPQGELFPNEQAKKAAKYF